MQNIVINSNENPLGPSPKAIRAAEEALKKGHLYPDSAYHDLKQTLANFLSVLPEQITVGNGSENILELIVKAFLQKEGIAIISQYTFLTIPLLLNSYGTKTIVVPAKNWGHDTKEMIKTIDKKTRVIFLVNPNNPTGTYFNTTDFHALLQAVPKHVLIVIDEAYAEYITVEDFPKTLTYLNDYPNLIITRTFSKAYGLAALRLGYAISSPKIAAVLDSNRLPFHVNRIAANAGCAAIDDQGHIQNTLRVNQQGLQQLKAGLKKLNLPYIPSIANFISVDVGDGTAVCEKLLRERITVKPLKAYQMPRHIRVSISLSDEIEKFLKALEIVIPAK